MATGSDAPALTLMPSQLGVPEFKLRPAPSDPVSHVATSAEPGAMLPVQLAPAVKSVPLAAFVILAANAAGAVMNAAVSAMASRTAKRKKFWVVFIGFIVGCFQRVPGFA